MKFFKIIVFVIPIILLVLLYSPPMSLFALESPEKIYTNSMEATINTNFVTPTALSIEQPYRKENQIPITPDMVKLLSSVEGQGALFDEQDLVSFDINGNIVGKPTTAWPAQNSFNHFLGKVPFKSYVDLGRAYEIEASAIFHNNSQSNVTLSYGTPDYPIPFSRYEVIGYQLWKRQANEKVVTRYVMIDFDIQTGTDATKELLLFGKPADISLPVYTQKPKLKIKKENVINVKGHVNFDLSTSNHTVQGADAWFDEQTMLSDPPTQQPSTGFMLNYQAYKEKLIVDIDLQQYVNLEKICVYEEGKVTGNLTLYAGAYDNFEKVLDYPLRSKGWVYLDIKELKGTVNARYIRIENTSPVVELKEIVFYGTPTSPYFDDAKRPTPFIPARAKMNDLIGTNAFLWNKDIPLLGGVGNVRTYITMQETFLKGTPQGLLNFNVFQMDQYFANNKHAGIETIPCLQGSIPYVSSSLKPVYPGADTTDPAAYKEHAKILYQFGARYGHTQIPNSKLSVSNNVPVKSGMGLLTYFENANEPDGNWLDGSPTGNGFSAEEFAAMTSADYDGHEGTLGDGYGLKNADPSAKLVFGGTAGVYLDYIKGMNYWFLHHRADQQFAADVINLHHYSRQKPPEEDHIYEKYKEVVDYVQQYIPGREVWISEFGWDTYITENGVRSTISAPDPVTQGHWLLRNYLLGAAAGIDKMQMYLLKDQNSTNAGTYASSGAIKDDRNQNERKPAWYNINTMRSLLEDAVFDTMTIEGTRYTLKFNAPNRDIYAIWDCSDPVQPVLYTLPFGTQAVMYTTLAHQKNNGIDTILHGRDTIEISGSPVFITDYKNSMVVLPPDASVVPSTYDGQQIISLASGNGTELYYTLDNSTPTQASIPYTKPIEMNQTGILKAIAVTNGVESNVVTFHYVINDLPLEVERIGFKDAEMNPVFQKDCVYYQVSCDKDTQQVHLEIDTKDYIKVLVNGKEMDTTKDLSVDLATGVNKLIITAIQTHTKAEKIYTIDVTRKSDKDIILIKPFGAGTALKSGYLDLSLAFDGDTVLDDSFYSPTSKNNGKAVPPYEQRVGYIDFGEHYKNIRITGAWTNYSGHTIGDRRAYQTLWWDNDNDVVNNLNLNEERITFSSAKNIQDHGASPIWIQDVECTADPIIPKARYLMILSNNGAGDRTLEFALVGYLEENQEP